MIKETWFHVQKTMYQTLYCNAPNVNILGLNTKVQDREAKTSP